jgi:tripartite-type tricarboxylate transporter receptor subunit TctC
VDEAIGTKGFEAVLWNVVAAPAGTPAAVVAVLSAATVKVMADATLHEQLAKMAILPTTDSNPAAAVAYIRSEMDKWRPVVEATGIKSD